MCIFERPLPTLTSRSREAAIASPALLQSFIPFQDENHRSPSFALAGFGTRFAAASPFVFNVVAAVSHPDLSPAGVKNHVLWGALLLVLFTFGSGKVSLDHRFGRRIGGTD
jgi:hypothetical protein